MESMHLCIDRQRAQGKNFAFLKPWSNFEGASYTPSHLPRKPATAEYLQGPLPAGGFLSKRCIFILLIGIWMTWLGQWNVNVESCEMDQ